VKNCGPESEIWNKGIIPAARPLFMRPHLIKQINQTESSEAIFHKAKLNHAHQKVAKFLLRIPEKICSVFGNSNLNIQLNIFYENINFAFADVKISSICCKLLKLVRSIETALIGREKLI
jgi:hypothetical protein